MPAREMLSCVCLCGRTGECVEMVVESVAALPTEDQAREGWGVDAVLVGMEDSKLRAHCIVYELKLSHTGQ